MKNSGSKNTGNSTTSSRVDRCYGNGVSTGIGQTASGQISTAFVYEDIYVSDDDAQILKRLAQKVANLASLPKMQEKRDLWRQHNALNFIRPLIFCDPENGWNEIITEAQMACKGTLARLWEMYLRKEIFWGEEMNDDRPIESVFHVPYTVAPENWGLEVKYTSSDFADGSKVWDSPIKDYDRDLAKLHAPEVEIDWKATNSCFELAKELFEPILEVKLTGLWWWSLGITMSAIMFRGLGNIYMDFIDQPDNVKALFNIIMEARLKKLDYLEAHNLLSLNNGGTYIGSGALGYTDELPGTDFAGEVKCQHLWGFAESQETVSVSPEMYAEYVFPYEKIILDRFGLNCYGCCEPIDPRWEIVKQHSNLRRISCSPWADYEKMAGYLGANYIFSMKPAPTQISSPKIDKNAIRCNLRRCLEITKGCAVELIMKDNHTLGHTPSNVVEWCRIAKEEIAGIYGDAGLI